MMCMDNERSCNSYSEKIEATILQYLILSLAHFLKFAFPQFDTLFSRFGRYPQTYIPELYVRSESAVGA